MDSCCAPSHPPVPIALSGVGPPVTELPPVDPGLIVACSHYGELYLTRDAGDSWRKLQREFTEIRALCWVPN